MVVRARTHEDSNGRCTAQLCCYIGMVVPSVPRLSGPMGVPAIKSLGDHGVVVEFDEEISPTTNGRVRALAAAFRGFPGMIETVPTLRSGLLVFDPLKADRAELVERADRLARTLPPDLEGSGRRHEVPVVYGGEVGPDLEAVAALHGLAPTEVIRLHSEVEYIVYMLGFAPGFPYLGILPEALWTPRLSSPRVRVPRGSVAIAESLTGIYPLQTPGGWRIIGRTPLAVYDPQQPDPLRFRPGDRIRFVPIDDADFPADGARSTPAMRDRSHPLLEVLDPGLYSTVQDLGRPGYRSLGVPCGGAMDPLSLQVGNVVAGNAIDAPAIECTAPGPRLRVLDEGTFVIAGADLSATIDGVDIELWTPISLRRGQTIRFGAPRRGLWAYVTVGGGLDIPKVLGSASTYVPGGLGGVGGRRLQAGDVLGRGEGPRRFRRPVRPVHIPFPADELTVRVIAGPQEEWFSEAGRAMLLREPYRVSVRSDRAGTRLEGGGIAHRDRADILSDGILPGAIQVPAGGQPIVIMPDGPTTGGYPKIGVVSSCDLRLLVQARPGTSVRFVRTTVDAAIEAWHERQREFQDLMGAAKR